MGRAAGRDSVTARGVALDATVLTVSVALSSLPVSAQEAPPAAVASAAAQEVPAELARLYEREDYFTLRERLGAPGPNEPPGMRVLRAAVADAFNDPRRSSELLRPVLGAEDGATVMIPDSLRFEARRIRLRNLLRMHRYAEAREVSDRLLEAPPAFVDSVELADLRNTHRLTGALADVPPQRTTARGATILRPDDRGRVRVTVGDSVRDYALDTGANISVLIRSEAEALGLRIREADLDLGSSTDLRIRADLAVADRVSLGGLELRNVVFLVVPDEVFTFGDFVIRGLVGFSIAEAAGELRFRSDGTIEIPVEVPLREEHNLALDGLTSLLRVKWEGEQLVCVLDTGANRSVFYEPFYRAHREWVESAGTPDTMRVGGAGGVRELSAYLLEDVTLRIGGESVTLPEIHVHTGSLERRPEDDTRDCNVGQDVLSRFDGYVLNFRSMSLLLR